MRSGWVASVCNATVAASALRLTVSARTKRIDSSVETVLRND